MESKALVKSTNNIVASRFFARTPSRIRWIVKICDVVDLFLRKPFWFFPSMFLILGSMRSSFFGKQRMHPFVHLSIVFWLYTVLQCWSSMSLNCLVFHTSAGISSSPAAFVFLIFLYTKSSSCVNCLSSMSNCLLIILMIGSCMTFGGFLSKFSMLFP